MASDGPIGTKPHSTDLRGSKEAVVQGRKIIIRKASNRRIKAATAGQKIPKLLKQLIKVLAIFSKKSAAATAAIFSQEILR